LGRQPQTALPTAQTTTQFYSTQLHMDLLLLVVRIKPEAIRATTLMVHWFWRMLSLGWTILA